MQVIEFKEFGSPSQPGLAERPLPQADANTAVVRIEAAAGAYIPPMIAGTLSLSQARTAYERLAKGGSGRVVLKPR